MMSRMSLTGHVFVGMGDAVVGVLLGLSAVSLTGGAMLPLAQALLGKGNSRRLAAALMAAAVVVAVGCSVGGIFPYSGGCGGCFSQGCGTGDGLTDYDGVVLCRWVGLSWSCCVGE
jgi:hypothetical protein